MEDRSETKKLKTNDGQSLFLYHQQPVLSSSSINLPSHDIGMNSNSQEKINLHENVFIKIPQKSTPPLFIHSVINAEGNEVYYLLGTNVHQTLVTDYQLPNSQKNDIPAYAYEKLGKHLIRDKKTENVVSNLFNRYDLIDQNDNTYALKETYFTKAQNWYRQMRSEKPQAISSTERPNSTETSHNNRSSTFVVNKTLTVSQKKPSTKKQNESKDTNYYENIFPKVKRARTTAFIHSVKNIEDEIQYYLISEQDHLKLIKAHPPMQDKNAIPPSAYLKLENRLIRKKGTNNIVKNVDSLSEFINEGDQTLNDDYYTRTCPYYYSGEYKNFLPETDTAPKNNPLSIQKKNTPSTTEHSAENYFANQLLNNEYDPQKTFRTSVSSNFKKA